MNYIDLRSDTVTRPDAEMRRAMAEAEVGDDVYGEDPTVARLEEESAAALGMEAALFVPSGTMGNQIALHLHGRPGRRGHLRRLLPHRAVRDGRHGGALRPDAKAAAIAPRAARSRRGRARDRERSHLPVADGSARGREHPQRGGRRGLHRPHLERLLAVARRHGLPVHLDGARIFNAAAALGLPAAEVVEGFDSVMFCLSKGLGAPVGSMLCGRRDFIQEARRVRKMFGGGMRQAGVIAAAGLLALRKGPARLAEDHENAARIARAVAELPGVEIDPGSVQTNIVVFGVSDPDFLTRLKENGVLGSHISHDRVRLVTHRDVSRAQVDEAIERIRKVAAVAA